MARRIGQLRQRGVSLIEAMIALAVMGFGMLAIVGVQTTLRYNADISKQRSEATRIAEQEIETIRTFTKVNTGGTASDEFDAITTGENQEIVGLNTKFILRRQVATTADNGRKMVTATVTWQDRAGQTQQVIIYDMITRVDPMLSGIVKAARPLTALGRRHGRHPTIPASAVNYPGDEKKSIFLPPNGSGVGWIFNNATGEIIQTCTSVSDSDLASDSALASKCTALLHSAQLVSGQIRFNLRGATHNPAGTVVSVMKPAGNGDAAWVIERSTSRLIQICRVPLSSATVDLTASDIASDCKNANVSLGPYLPVDVGDLTPIDSEAPDWPTLPATVEFDKSWANRTTTVDSSFDCYADYQTSTLAHADTSSPSDRKSISYFCIVRVSDDGGWGGRTVVKPLTFTETFTGGTGGTWSIGSAPGEYRVCRYTQDHDDYTDNEDHPATYSAHKASCTMPSECRPVKGNLINQNFLVIAGTKNCPEEATPVDPAGGNLVNSNTRQHQPVP